MNGISRREFIAGLLGAAASAGLSHRGAFAAPKGAGMRFGLVTYLWGKDMSLPALLEACEGSGLLGVELLPVEKEAWRGLFRVEELARIYMMTGEFEKAIDRIEYLLSIPGELSVHLLRLDPTWDPRRNNQRFQKLLQEGK